MDEKISAEIKQAPQPPDGQAKKLSIISLIGLIISVVALLLSALPIINNFAAVLAVLSLILGIVGIIRSKKKQTGKGLGVSTVVISIVAIIVVFASQAMYGAAIDEASKSMDEEVSKVTGDSTDELLKTDVSVDLGEFTLSTDEYELTTTSLPVKVTNKNDASKSYNIQIEAVGTDGQRIADDYVYASDLGAKQSQEFKVFEYVEQDKLEAIKSAEFKIVKVSQM